MLTKPTGRSSLYTVLKGEEYDVRLYLGLPKGWRELIKKQRRHLHVHVTEPFEAHVELMPKD
jgi:hypothetical protein